MIKRNGCLIKKMFVDYIFANFMSAAAVSLGLVLNSIIIGNVGNGLLRNAMTSCYPVIQFFFSFHCLFNVGGALAAARLLGKNRPDEARNVLTCAVLVSLVLQAVFTVVGLCFSEGIANLLCKEQELLSNVKDFVRIAFCTSIFHILLPGLAVYIQTAGSPKTATIGLALGNGISLGLHALFIYMGMGLAGAAAAMAIGYGTGCAFFLVYFLRKKLPLYFVRKIKLSCLGVVCLCGLPIALASVSNTARMMISNVTVSVYLHSSGLTVMSVGMNLLMISSMLISGMTQTVQPIGSYMKGVNDTEGFNIAVKFGLKILMILLTVLSLFVLAFPNAFAAIFNASDPDMATDLRLFTLSVPIRGFLYYLMVTYQINDKKVPALVISFVQALLVIPLLMLFAPYSPVMVWLSFTLSELILFVVIVVIGELMYRLKNKRLMPVMLLEKPDANTLSFSLENKTEQIQAAAQALADFAKSKQFQCGETVYSVFEQLCSSLITENGKPCFIDVVLILEDEGARLIIKDNLKITERKLSDNAQSYVAGNQNITVINFC